ncbi:MAG: TRAP transporter substrate-binding protein DctP [Clostridiales Family XIII bacterium]|jgi:TRAP-type C4-dicarboxylate transport system substrate-binding protein|nr:TRAP transporter substrate-binding protein DctP [Clostridiales Family XIII bacterium]
MSVKHAKKSRFVKFALAAGMLSAAVILFAACGGGDAGGEEAATETADAEPITLRLASDAPLEHIATGLNEGAAEKVKERTEGRVLIEYFPGSALGGYETVYEELVIGSIDIAQITVPDALDARLGSAYLPYYATSYEEAKILYAPDSFMSKTFAELTAANNVRFLGWVLEGFIGMGVVKDPTDVMTPGTPKGIQLRSPAMATFRYVQEDLGYNPVTVPYAEVPTAIQTKVVDGWIGGTPNMNYAWVGEVINKMYVNYMHAEATCYVMSELSLSKLSEADRQTLIEVFEEQSMQSFEDAQANEELYKQKLQDDYGVEVVELTPEQLKVNADFVRDVTWTRLEEILTPELIAGFREEVAKLQ